MPNTSREDIKKEVQTVLSMRIPSLDLQKNQQTFSQALQKIAPGTPQTSQQHGLAHDSNNIIIQSSLDAKSVKDEDAVKDTAIAIKGEEAQSSSGGVGRQWVAHAAESDDGKHTRASQLRSALKVSPWHNYCVVACCRWLLMCFAGLHCVSTCFVNAAVLQLCKSFPARQHHA